MKKWFARVCNSVVKFALTVTVVVVAIVIALWLVAIALSPVFMAITVYRCW